MFSGMDIGSGPGGCGESERTATGPDLVLIYSEPSKESKTTQTTLFIRELKEGGGGSNGGPPLPKQPGEIEPIPALSDALSKYYLNSSGNVNLLERKGVA